MSGTAPPQEISFVLNGVETVFRGRALDRLLDVLRYQMGLTGTKEGCGEGECGACTVHLDGVPVNSCLVLVGQVRGRRVDTVESLGPESLGPLHASGATQCGACTPGVVMTARFVLDHPELLERSTLRQLMAGNLCRCTGYDGIVDGISAALGVSASPAGRSGNSGNSAAESLEQGEEAP